MSQGLNLLEVSERTKLEVPPFPKRAAPAPAISGPTQASLLQCILATYSLKGILRKAPLWEQTLHLLPSLVSPHPQDWSQLLSLHLPLK